jgi:hypothetical protein
MMQSKMMAGGGMMKKGYALKGGAMPMETGNDGKEKPSFCFGGVKQNGCWWWHDVQDEGWWWHYAKMAPSKMASKVKTSPSLMALLKRV